MRILITAGPTREPIDAVRYISNRSSGKVGLALAMAAHQVDHQVTLLLGPITSPFTDQPKKSGIEVYQFETSNDLKSLLDAQWPKHDILIMAAAVTDYRPTTPVENAKIPRTDQSISIKFQPTEDLVTRIASNKRADQRVIAFALEELSTMQQRAQEKMHSKGVDAIIANPLETMDSQTISPVLFTSNGQRLTPHSESTTESGPITKDQFATWLIQQLERV